MSAALPKEIEPVSEGRFVVVERAMLSLVMTAMVLLPLSEAVFRRTGINGLPGAGPFLQHLTLILGMLGGAYAAGRARLLALSPLTQWLSESAAERARIIAGGVAGAIAIWLAWGAWLLVQSEREAGTILALGVRVWVLQAVLPLGFLAIAWRLLRGASTSWRGRALALSLALAGVALGLWPPLPAAQLVWPALAALLVATLLGAPVFATLGGAALILFWGADQPIASISLSHYSLSTNATLPALPLFTLAGYWLAEGGASRRLVRVFQAWFGPLRGGPAIVTALACAFFTSFTGASGVTILALGGLLMPVLIGARYPERSALGLLTSAGSLGLLFPPCLPVILYSVVANANSMSGGGSLTMQKMFMGGAIPGALMVLLTAWWGARQQPRESGLRLRFDRREAFSAAAAAKWELLLPLITLVALFGGFATPVEAAALTALYAIAIETLVHRELSIWRDGPRVFGECALVVGGVLLILGVALGFTNYLVDAQVAINTVDWMTANVHSKWVFLLLLNLVLLVVGCLMDIYSAIVVVVPLIVPLGEAYGVDPVHLGIIFLVNLELGFLTPPVGMNLFLASYRFSKPMPEVIRAVLPMLFVLLGGMLAITYLPWLTTWCLP